MKKACVTLLAVLMSCAFMASCQKTVEETTTSSESETSQEDDGISVGDKIVFGNYPQKKNPETNEPARGARGVVAVSGISALRPENLDRS